MCNNLDLRRKKAQVVPMCSIFHLLQSCEKKLNNGSLVEVDALFGCSVILFDGANLNDLSVDEIECACDMLFYTINWFKELLNAFMFITEEENHQSRLITRLRNILLMESILEQLMGQVSNYAPLEFHTNSNSMEIIKHTTAALSIGDNTSQSTVEESQSLPKPKTSNAINNNSRSHSNAKINSIQDLRSYTRAFDVDILELLKYSEQLEEEDEKLTLKEIDYILQDIEQKLDIKVSPPPAVFFGKKKVDKNQHQTSNFTMLARIDSRTLMRKVLVYLPVILQTLENLYADLQERVYFCIFLV